MTATTGDRPLFAAFLIVCAMTVIGVVDNFVRVFSDDLTLWEFHFIRAAMALPMIAFAAFALGGLSLRPKRLSRVALRSLLIAGAMMLLFASLPVLPMAQVTAGFLTSPLFVLMFSVLFLGEPVGPRRIAAVAVGFFGAMLVVDPFSKGVDWRVFLPMGAAAFYAGSLIVTRRACRNEAPTALVFADFIGFLLIGAVGLGVFAWVAPAPDLVSEVPFVLGPTQLFVGEPPSWTVLFWMLGMAAGAAIAILGLIRAYQSAEASFLTLFDFTYVIAGSAAAYVIWGETPPPTIWIGATLIILSGAYLSYRQMAATARSAASRVGAE